MNINLIAAITNDNFIAAATQQKSTRWTSPEDTAFFTKQTKQAGIVSMGSTTYQTIGKPLAQRINIVITNHPEKIKEATDIANLPNYQGSFPTSLYTTNLEPKNLIQFLTDKNYPEIYICGGSSIYTQFMETGLIDTIYLTKHTNVTFNKGIPLFTKYIPLPPPTTTNLSKTTILHRYNLK